MSPQDAAAAMESPTGLDEREIIARIRGGEHALFAALVRRYNQRLYRVGLAYLRRPELVEDAMQNAYLNAFRRLAQFHDRAAFSTWLTRIMINECLMQLRRHRLLSAAVAEAETDPAAERVAHPEGARRVDAAEVKALLEQMITELPENYRLVYMLREIQELDTEETAALLAISPENVKVRLHRARELLKSRLLASAAGHELFTYGDSRCRELTTGVMAAIAARCAESS